MAEEAAQPPLTINTQYVKDHSFENPNAPSIYGTLRSEKPDISLSVEVTPKQLQDQVYEVVLGLRASAKIGEATAFMAELDYAAVISLAPDLSEEVRERLVMVEVPRHLFPFARAILADDTRDGGFPPLMMSPIDFAQLYLSRRAQAQSADGESAKGEANGQA
ncbi:MAG: protein-export chaperone SecB [Kiloniellaceae bacterium]|jgi:preprotein translocase subunit SecB|nr:protein-export chaperone SecB [Kiloniellaceae bacterium]